MRLVSIWTEAAKSQAVALSIVRSKSLAGEHIGGAIAVLNVGGMDHDTDQKSLRIGDDMALAALGCRATINVRMRVNQDERFFRGWC